MTKMAEIRNNRTIDIRIMDWKQAYESHLLRAVRVSQLLYAFSSCYKSIVCFNGYCTCSIPSESTFSSSTVAVASYGTGVEL